MQLVGMIETNFHHMTIDHHHSHSEPWVPLTMTGPEASLLWVKASREWTDKGAS